MLLVISFTDGTPLQRYNLWSSIADDIFLTLRETYYIEGKALRGTLLNGEASCRQIRHALVCVR